MANIIHFGTSNELIIFNKGNVFHSIFEVSNNIQIVNGVIVFTSTANSLLSIYANPGDRVCVKFASFGGDATTGYIGTGTGSSWGVYTTISGDVKNKIFKSPKVTVLGKVKIDIVSQSSVYIEKIWIEKSGG